MSSTDIDDEGVVLAILESTPSDIVPLSPVSGQLGLPTRCIRRHPEFFMTQDMIDIQVGNPHHSFET
jgi:hypothetical protein